MARPRARERELLTRQRLPDDSEVTPESTPARLVPTDFGSVAPSRGARGQNQSCLHFSPALWNQSEDPHPSSQTKMAVGLGLVQGRHGRVGKGSTRGAVFDQSLMYSRCVGGTTRPTSTSAHRHAV